MSLDKISELRAFQELQGQGQRNIDAGRERGYREGQEDAPVRIGVPSFIKGFTSGVKYAEHFLLPQLEHAEKKNTQFRKTIGDLQNQVERLSLQLNKEHGVDVQHGSLPNKPADMSWLMYLKDTGYIARSGNPLLLGFDDTGNEVYLEWGEVGAYAVAGTSGSGKTSTMTFLACQAAMMGAKLVICDKHGNTARSLIQKLSPLKDAFLLPPAVDAKSIIKTLQTIDKLARQRVEGKSKDDFPIMLLIDEFSSLMGNEGGDKEFKKEAERILVNFANEYRKVGFQAFLMGQSWKADMAGGTTLRNALGAELYHSLKEGEAAFLLPKGESELKRKIAKLKKGFAVYHLRGEAQALAVPYITEEEIVPELVPEEYRSKNNTTVTLGPENLASESHEILQDLMGTDTWKKLSKSEKTKKIGTGKAETELREQIKALVDLGWSGNQIYSSIGGNRAEVLKLVKEIKNN